MFWSWLSSFGSATRQPSPLSSRRHGRRGVSRPRFKPTVVALEDRTVPSGGTSFYGGPAPSFGSPPVTGPATHLQVIAPLKVQAGQTFKVLVIAETADNLPATGFTDTVILSSSDPNATGNDNGPAVNPGPVALVPLPLTYTFTQYDHGFHVFDVNLTTLGSQSISAKDATDSTVTPGTANTTVYPQAMLAKLLVVMPRSTTVGVPTPVTIVPLDQYGHPIYNFTGTVSLSTSDSAATGLPSSYTFTSSDHGYHTFKVTFETPDGAGPTATGSAPQPTTVTATDGSITNTGSIWVFPASSVTRFAIFPLRPVVQGVATPVIVVALNASNQILPGYSGTVTFNSSDTTATASATSGGTQTSLSTFSYTFTSADAGLHVFYVTFGTPGKQTFTVSDSTAGVNSTIDLYVITTLVPRHSWFWF